MLQQFEDYGKGEYLGSEEDMAHCTLGSGMARAYA